jgi:hypothetical protein
MKARHFDAPSQLRLHAKLSPSDDRNEARMKPATTSRRADPGQPGKWDAVVYKAEDIKDYRPNG